MCGLIEGALLTPLGGSWPRLKGQFAVSFEEGFWHPQESCHASLEGPDVTQGLEVPTPYVRHTTINRVVQFSPSGIDSGVLACLALSNRLWLS